LRANAILRVFTDLMATFALVKNALAGGRITFSEGNGPN
tara:strand:+ start:1166 stop:1282 length:117 start_codon:yes stop_codon:yes gene_type:complete